MKVLQLDLAAFGPFENFTLDFSAGQFGLHLVHGPNEAGKSSTLRALRQALYGIDQQTPDNFRIAYPKLKLGATLEHEGETFSFVRLKRLKHPLRTPDDAVLPDDCLDRFLGEVDQSAFVRQFGLNWDDLVRGGREMVRSEGEMARILFAAGSGLTVLAEVQDAIEAEMRELFLATGSNPKINVLLTELKQAEDALRQVRQSSDQWMQLAETLKAARQRKDSLTHVKKELEREVSRLERIRNAKRPISKYRQTQQELQQLAEAVLLPEGFTERREQAREAHRTAKQTLKTIEQTRARLAGQQQAIAINPLVLEQAEMIESLNQAIGAYLKSVEDCPKIDRRRREAETEAQRLLAELHPGTTEDPLEQLRLSDADRVAIREWGQQRDVLLDRVETTQRAVAEARREQTLLARRRDQLEAVNDTTALKSALKSALRKGSLEADRDQKLEELRLVQAQAERDLKRLPFWSGTLDELERLSVPMRETVNQFQTRLDEAAQQVRRFEQDREHEHKKLAQIAGEFLVLEKSGPVPTEEELTQARELRQQGWALVQRVWRDGEKAAKELKAFLTQAAGASDLAGAFERTMLGADELADGLRREANRVTEKQRLLADRTYHAARLPELETQIGTAQDQLKQIEAEWGGLWKPLGFAPASPAEMLEWLVGHLHLMTTVKSLHPQRAFAEKLDELIQEHRERLLDCLENLGEPRGDAETPSLQDLVDRAQQLIETMAQRQSLRDRWEEDWQEAETVLPKREEETADAVAKFAAWQKRWAGLMMKLHLTDDSTPGQANAVLDGISRLFERLREESELSQRVADMRDFNADFERRVRAVAEHVGLILDDQPPEQAASKLQEELLKAKQASKKLAELVEEQETQQDALHQAERQIRQSESLLEAMCADAGCRQPDELPLAEKNSARRRQLERDLHESREQILELAGEASFESFLNEADSEETDALASRLAEQQEQREATDAELTKTIEEAERAQNQLDALGGGNQAALAAEKKQTILADVGGYLERYVQLRLAYDVLLAGVERYRKKHQGPVLKRASDLFRQLTCGSFLRLQTDVDDHNKPMLVGWRRQGAGEERVEVNGMSDGTADQLYLALRMASLEDWLDHHAPMPFIVDDVLINFDDARAVAALEALAELSRRTQVIFFTHHQHLVKLAEKRLSKNVLIVHELDPSQPRPAAKPRAIKDPEATTLF